MKVKDILDYIKPSKLRNSVTDTAPSTAPTAPEYEERIIKCLTDPSYFVVKSVTNAIKDLSFLESRHIGAEEHELLLCQLRINYKNTYRVSKAVGPKEGFDVRKMPRPLSNDEISDAFLLFINRVNESRLERARTELACTLPSTSAVETLVTAWTGTADEKVVAVVAHALWQIKRKLYGKSVENHVMPILYGQQNSGKSRAVKALLEPLDKLGFALYASVSQLSDERYLKVLSEHYVLFADEMTNAEKTDVNALKNIITADVLTPRKLGTNQNYYIQQNCTFIGASNRPVNEMVFDATGMRRFYQINCSAQMDWVTVNSINYAELFKGIDENLDGGYLVGEVLRDVRSEQDILVSHDDVHHFSDDEGIAVGKKELSTFIPFTELYVAFQTWTIKNGTQYKPSLKELNKKLRNRGFIDSSLKVAGVTQRGFWLIVDPDKCSQLLHNDTHPIGTLQINPFQTKK